MMTMLAGLIAAITTAPFPMTFAFPGDLQNAQGALLEYEMVTSEDAMHWQRPFRKTGLGFWSYADPFLHQGRLHFAIWKDGGMQTVTYAPNRMTAAVAEEEGTFTTAPFAWPKGGLALDADATNGWIEAELLDASGNVVPDTQTARFENVDGATLPLAWSPSATDDYDVRFRLHNARIFALIEKPVQQAVRDTVRVAQMHGVPKKWDLDANFEVFLKMLDKASAKRAEIFITPTASSMKQ